MAQSSIAQSIQAIHDAQQATLVVSETTETELVRTKVYIGLNDGETGEQAFDTDRYISVLKRVCIQYGVPFSLDVVKGGYIHDSGEYTEENAIVLTFIGVSQETVDEVAKDLCVFFRQESVLITTDHVQGRTIRKIRDEYPRQ